MGPTWTGLLWLPAPVATFGAWVLKNVPCEHLAFQELEAQVVNLRTAVSKVGFGMRKRAPHYE